MFGCGKESILVEGSFFVLVDGLLQLEYLVFVVFVLFDGFLKSLFVVVYLSFQLVNLILFLVE